MTAEVAILNRSAVAIAADSAATLGDADDYKMLASANKVFALSKYHAVGIMIYGNAHFMNVPWETIIKLYRNRLSDKKYDTLKEYGKSFIEFLQDNKEMYPEAEQKKYIYGRIYSYFEEMLSHFTELIDSKIEDSGSINHDEISKIFKIVVRTNYSIWEDAKSILQNDSEARAEFLAKYQSVIDQVIKLVFQNIPISKKLKDQLTFIATRLFTSYTDDAHDKAESGIVITGFGENDIFPSIVSYSLNGIANDLLKFRENSYQEVTTTNSAVIIPYAQTEMVESFIDGISPRIKGVYEQILYETFQSYPKIILEKLAGEISEEKLAKIEKSLKKTSGEQVMNELKKVESIKFNHFIEPILSVVNFLSKNELAEMAESLVNLTCLRKKISMDDETVGGPIDVAVISKGDGLIWIKRKHYFEPNLNQQFFTNYLTR